jgi:hypothetical protein
MGRRSALRLLILQGSMKRTVWQLVLVWAASELPPGNKLCGGGAQVLSTCLAW